MGRKVGSGRSLAGQVRPFAETGARACLGSRMFVYGQRASGGRPLLEGTLTMADQRGSARATWIVIAIVLLGVVIVGYLPGRSSFGSAGGDHPRLAALMGSAQRTSDTKAFTGAEMTAMMGSCSLDLTHAQIAPGTEATIDVFAMMGSVTIRVPDGWTVDTRAIPVMGAIRDDRWPAPKTAADASTLAQPPRLVLRGMVMMGSIFIKS